MHRLPVRWLLFPSYVAISIVTLALTSIFLLNILRQFLVQEFEGRIALKARLIQTTLAAQGNLAESSAQLDSLVTELATRGEVRITIVKSDGRVLADSHFAAATLDDFGSRPEVKRALIGIPGAETRFSHSRQERTLFYAVPTYEGIDLDSPVGVLRVATPLSEIDAVLREARNRALAGASIAGILAAALGWLVARRFARPMEQMRIAAEHYSSGNLAYRIGPLLSAEGLRLGEALNQMAGDLNQRILDLARRNQEQDSLFRSMIEGVIAVDPDGHILSINPAARRLFDVEDTPFEGRPLREALRHSSVLQLLDQTLDSEVVVEKEILLEDPERFVQAHGAPLILDGEQIGAIAVFNDITRQKNMDRERRELVANVSHELRTPVTAIRGYLETLERGAIDNPKEARRFISIASRQTGRLSSLIEDLLHLAKIERAVEAREVQLVRQVIAPVLSIVAQTFSPLTNEGTSIKVDCDPDLEAEINPELLEQAVGNLISNALRYGAAEQTVRVRGARIGDWVEISVQDRGDGIPPAHLDRLFERFYTVDKARSRQKGGTGLGLSIVKHVARAHRGDVTVESEVRYGSRFTMRIPYVGPPDPTPEAGSGVSRAR